MSSFYVTGFFALSNGRHVTLAVAGADRPKTFIMYSSTIQCEMDDVVIPADVRLYARPSHALMPDNTIVWMLAKAYLPSTRSANLDVIFCKSVPGNPDDDDYEDGVPDFPYPVFFGVGQVSSTHRVLEDGSRVFDVATSQFVREAVRFSTIQCALSNSNARWSNTSPPAIRSTIHFVGSAESLTSAGNVSISLGDLSFLNIPSQSSQADASNASPAADSNSPQKKRKFKAVATTVSASSNTPAPIASTSASAGPSTLVPLAVPTTSTESSLTPVPATPPALPTEVSEGSVVVKKRTRKSRGPARKAVAGVSPASKPAHAKSSKGKQRASNLSPVADVDYSASERR